MKYVKLFGELNEGKKDLLRKTKRTANQIITLQSILQSFYALFMDHNAIKQIWKAAKSERQLMKVALDIYNHFIDIENILELPKDKQIKYAKNLGIDVNEDTNVISEIAQQLYVQNYKRNLKEDLEKTIKYLEDGTNFEVFEEPQKLFLEKIKEIKEVL
jgi:hypothetical protein